MAHQDLGHDGQRPGAIYRSLRRLFLDDKYADLTIRCDGQDFRVHRAILCPQSPFFDRACHGGFKEASSSVIELPEDDADILMRFLQFVYTGNYEDGEYPYGLEPAFAAVMTPEEICHELQQPPGIETGGVEAEEASDWPMPDDESQAAAVDGAGTGAGAGVGHVLNCTAAEDDPWNEGDESEGSEYPSPPSSGSDEPYEYSETGSDGVAAAEAQGEGGEEGAGDDTKADAEYEQYRRGPNSLLTSLRVYVMADKFDVPALKLLARHRFYMTAREVFEMYEDFGSVVDELYETTAPTDKAMREIPCRLLAASYSWDGPALERLEPVMRKHGDLAVSILHYSKLYWSVPKCLACRGMEVWEQGDGQAGGGGAPKGHPTEGLPRKPRRGQKPEH